MPSQMSESNLSLEQCVYLACLLEATARKPGNVHPSSDFNDVTYVDFLISAAAVAPVLARAGETGVATAILQAVQETQRLITNNTNLGILLLLAPLCAAAEWENLRPGVNEILQQTSIADTRLVYEAIRCAQPGGLGTAAQQDVFEDPECTLSEAMQLAADRDLIARQYANGFADVFEAGVPYLAEALQADRSLERAIIECHLRLMAQYPDTLIARKCGLAVAEDAARRADQVLHRGRAGSPDRDTALHDLDRWLRADGHRRNPGTTADLVAASLFVALYEGIIPVPFRW